MSGVFDGDGKLLGCASSPIQIWKDGKYVEQSSTDIWLAICSAVKSVCAKCQLGNSDICGIGFTATCSLGKFLLTCRTKGMIQFHVMKIHKFSSASLLKFFVDQGGLVWFFSGNRNR